MNPTPNPTPADISVDAGAVIALLKTQVGNMALDLAVATARAETAERRLAAQTGE